MVAPEHGPTFPAIAPRQRIDHVLHSPDLRTVRTEVRSTSMSDHAALVVDLERVDEGPGVGPASPPVPGATDGGPR
jgi:endonuclease/exonuclease/phosphatase family metal-dependent hydrolase